MRTSVASVVAVLFAATAVAAQRGMANQPAGPAPTCPPSGYSQPYYALFGQNGGDGQTAYEIASPCIGRDVRDAAVAIGMGRNRLLGVKNVITIMFTAEGTMADAGGTSRLTKADLHIAYYLPAMRMFLEGTRANGMPLKEIRVFADTYAWNETEQGRGATPVMNALNDRAPLLKLTPFGALWSVIEAEAHTTVTTVNGRTVLTGTSPHDGIEVSTTLDNEHRPVEVTAKANGHTYGATFADYRDTWESKYLVIFPSQIRWTLDGKPLADLRVTAFKSNPYVVFPIPGVVRQKTSN
ncbi:MAG: hypothetical protein EXQ53_04265 [Acidobacteria bacterium]|nr:hypothetical protein [Acidobacteriota bacterium]